VSTTQSLLRGAMGIVSLASIAVCAASAPTYAATRTRGAAVAANDIATLAATHNGYVVVGKKLGADVARAVVAVKQCEASSGPGACDALRDNEHRAEVSLLRRGRAVLNATDLAETNPVYAAASIAVIPVGDTTLVYTDLPVQVAAGQQPSPTGETIAGALHGLRASRAYPSAHPADGGQLPTNWYMRYILVLRPRSDRL